MMLLSGGFDRESKNFRKYLWEIEPKRIPLSVVAEPAISSRSSEHGMRTRATCVPQPRCFDARASDSLRQHPWGQTVLHTHTYTHTPIHAHVLSTHPFLNHACGFAEGEGSGKEAQKTGIKEALHKSLHGFR